MNHNRLRTRRRNAQHRPTAAAGPERRGRKRPKEQNPNAKTLDFFTEMASSSLRWLLTTPRVLAYKSTRTESKHVRGYTHTERALHRNAHFYFLSWPKPAALQSCQRSAHVGPTSLVTAYWLVATWMARAIVERTRPSSIVSRPAIVHPPGAGCGDRGRIGKNCRRREERSVSHLFCRSSSRRHHYTHW